jgi:hypothetical protein
MRPQQFKIHFQTLPYSDFFKNGFNVTENCKYFGSFNERSPSGPAISDLKALPGTKIFHHLEKEDEGPQEVTTRNPIKLEVPVPVSSKRDYFAILWNYYQTAEPGAEKFV